MPQRSKGYVDWDGVCKALKCKVAINIQCISFSFFLIVINWISSSREADTCWVFSVWWDLDKVLGTWRNDMSGFSGTEHSGRGDRCQHHGTCGAGVVGRLVKSERPTCPQAGRKAVGTELRLGFQLLGNGGSWHRGIKDPVPDFLLRAS